MSGRLIIETRDLTRTYRMGETDVHALRGVSLEIHEGEMVAITGPSGSGKSTLMAILGALDQPSGGSYKLDGYEIGEMRDDDQAMIRNWRIGFVFQQFNLLSRSSALTNVALPLVYAGVSAKERDARARAKLELVGLGDRMDHKPTELSGGQQQRVALARALVNEPAIILADEPTGNLDSKTGEEIMSLFWQLHEEQGITLIIVTHDAEVAEQTERVITLRDGAIVADEHNGHNVIYRRQAHVSASIPPLAEAPAVPFTGDASPVEDAPVDDSTEADTPAETSPAEEHPADHQSAVALLARASAEEVARRVRDEAQDAPASASTPDSDSGRNEEAEHDSTN